jgi:hypothetical protein
VSYLTFLKRSKMKKQISSDRKRSFRGIISVTILSAMLCVFSAKADNKSSVTSSAKTCELSSENGVKNCMDMNAETNYEALEAELSQEAEYRADVFVESDMELEYETWMNSFFELDDEAVIAEITLPVVYNAKDFVDAEMALEVQNQVIN